MDDVLAIVLAGGRGTRLAPLTLETAKPVLPFAGNFRLIDFAFSNCINSGLSSLLVLTRRRGDPTHQYVERLQDLLPRAGRNRLWVEAAADLVHGPGGTAEAVRIALPLIRRLNPRLVLVLASDHVYRMDYTAMIDRQRSTGAAVTVGSVEVPSQEASRYGVLGVTPGGRIATFVEKPVRPPEDPSRPGLSLASMGIYVFDRDCLERALLEDAIDESSSHDFGRDVIPRLVTQGRARAHLFADYWRDVGTLQSYHAAHRDILEPRLLNLLRDPAWPIWSAAWPLLPRHAPISRHGSLLCPGCLCEPGSRVRGSVISPAARVEQGALVEDCVVLEGARIGGGACLRGAIVDRGVSVPPGASVGRLSADDPGVYVVSEAGVFPADRTAQLTPSPGPAGGPRGTR